MKVVKYIIFFIGFFFSTCTAMAQNNQPVDSVIAPVDSVSTGFENATDEGLQPISSLQLNPNYVSSDSIIILKKNKELQYVDSMDSTLRKLKSEALKNEEELQNKPYKRSWIEIVLLSRITRIIFSVIAALFVLTILYKLFFTKGIFRKRSFSGNVLAVKENDISENGYNYDVLLQQALNSENFRQAVRYLFLQTLQRLSDKGQLILSADKTNYQYLNELKITGAKNVFSKLVMYYEYVWYGEMDIDKKTFTEVNDTFNKFKELI